MKTPRVFIGDRDEAAPLRAPPWRAGFTAALALLLVCACQPGAKGPGSSVVDEAPRGEDGFGDSDNDDGGEPVPAPEGGSTPPVEGAPSDATEPPDGSVPPTDGSVVDDLTGPATEGTTITRFGISWEFTESATMGRYANGDWWVVGPVTITRITPGSVVNDGRTMNGSVINPESGMFPQHGFDSAMGGSGVGWNPDLNVGRPNGQTLSAGNPLRVGPGSSLVSSVSHPEPENRPTLTDIAILTVVEAPPPAGAFRPPYSGDDKTHRWTTADLDYGILQDLPPVAGAPAPDGIAEAFDRPWFELGTETIGRYFHPENHQPEYGRDMAFILGDALLTLHLDYSDAEKQLLYVRLVQWGLDLYGCAQTGGLWADNGGHNAGRKGGLVLAGVALHDPDILEFADATSDVGFIFAEDRQTFYVSEDDVGRALHQADGRPREPYIQADVGLAEWGEKHASQPTRDGRNWSTFYRDINYTSQLGEALAMQLTTGATAAWNWPAFFDYTDRSFEISGDDMPEYPAAMWRAYRDHARR